MLFKLLFFVSFSLLIQHGKTHSYHLGACPNIEPQKEFDMKRMLGIWYVLHKTSTGSSCILYNFTKTDEPFEYKIEEVSQHFLLGLTPLKHGYHYKGTLKVIDESNPAKMTVRFPLSVAGSATFTVFMTDYSNFAGIFTCQKLGFAHRRSTAILSREKTLDKVFLDKMRSRLSASQIDPFDLSLIKQTDCPRNLTDAYNININDDTISAHAAAEVIRKAGEKIGDGVEYIAGKSRDTYHKLTDSKEAEKMGRNVVTPDPDTEWLP